jgi:hypothetical protein
MPVDSKNQLQKQIRERKYLNKDFDGFRADLEEYARQYFPNKIRDFSSTGLGGLLLELAATVGDVQSFYLDFQFKETSYETAVEPRNIERLLRDNGVDIVGASPAVVSVDFYVKVPAETVTGGVQQPFSASLPIINAGTTLEADNGVIFELIENVDFSEEDTTRDYSLKADVTIAERNPTSQVPTYYVLKKKGTCISGQRATESFAVNGFEQFKRYTLAQENVTDIISVVDSAGNTYYEVEYLTQDTVYQSLVNIGSDSELVKEVLQIIPAPYRFYSETSLQTRLTTLVFGGGNAESLDDDIVPDPSEFAVPLYGKTNFSRFTLNPGNLLRTSTLGVLAPNVTVTVQYRYGGGLSHNIEPETIRGVRTLLISFPGNPSTAIAQGVRESVDALNEKEAKGGDDAPTLDELKVRVPGARAAQSRIVTKEDLLARIYSMPSNFGRVFRANVHSNPDNPNAAQLFVLCRNQFNELVIASDTLKKNLSTYLNQYRLISDAIDILDAQVVNIQVKYEVVITPGENKELILQNINAKLVEFFSIKNFEIDQPILLADVQNIIYNNTGVIGIEDIQILNKTGVDGDLVYSDTTYNTKTNTYKGLIFPPTGGIFELKYPTTDIIGAAS